MTEAEKINPIRQLTDLELAKLSNNWENPIVDTRYYYQSVAKAWEVTKEDYTKARKIGLLCQAVHGLRFYIGA